MQQHRHQFLNTVERSVPAGKIIHAILDNSGPLKHPKVNEWLADQPRWVFHSTPISASWLNAVEGFYSIITRRRIRRGVFKSVAELEAALHLYHHPTRLEPVHGRRKRGRVRSVGRGQSHRLRSGVVDRARRLLGWP